MLNLCGGACIELIKFMPLSWLILRAFLIIQLTRWAANTSVSLSFGETVHLWWDLSKVFRLLFWNVYQFTFSELNKPLLKNVASFITKKTCTLSSRFLTPQADISVLEEVHFWVLKVLNYIHYLFDIAFVSMCVSVFTHTRFRVNWHGSWNQYSRLHRSALGSWSRLWL